MADRSRTDPPPGATESAALAAGIAALNEVLLAVAGGDFSARAPRSYAGDPLDVLAFLINASAEEIGELVAQLHRQSEDLKATRDQLVLAEKLGALGQLSAGVAHELNQPLTAIQMAVEWIQARPDATVSACAPDLSLIAEATRRMGRIIDGIRSFGRAGAIGRQSIPATKPVEDALVLTTDALRQQGVVIERGFDSGLPEISADPDRLQQVFVNLVLNARDALNGRDHERKVRVEVARTPTGVLYAVEDNGHGVSPEHVQRLFDPFFTTKPVGKGMGLGLSISHGIVAEHGGTLTYQRAPSGGSRFSFTLPFKAAP